MTKKKTQSGQTFAPDNILRSYWSKNEHFADLFNGLLFGGREVIQPDELEEVDSDASVLAERGEYAEAIKLSRDNVKICKRSTVHGVELALLGLESQEHIHYAMPMRVMGYDYSAYKKQYDGNAQKYRESRGKGLTRDEFLSTTIYLRLISLTASKELPILLLKLYNDGAIGISFFLPDFASVF